MIELTGQFHAGSNMGNAVSFNPGIFKAKVFVWKRFSFGKKMPERFYGKLNGIFIIMYQ